MSAVARIRRSRRMRDMFSPGGADAYRGYRRVARIRRLRRIRDMFSPVALTLTGATVA
ncbi:hypothetical protein [Kluyvera intermedia]